MRSALVLAMFLVAGSLPGIGSLQMAISVPAGGTLNLRDFGLVDMPTGLSTLPELGSLDVSCNPLRTVSAIPRLERLRNLRLDHTRLDTLGGLGAMRSLYALSIQDSCLAGTGLAGIPTMPRLVELDLSGNRIERLRRLQVQPSVERLDLSHNELASVADFPLMPRLSILDLSYNHISTLNGLPPLPRLNVLDLRGDPVDQQMVERFQTYFKATFDREVIVVTESTTVPIVDVFRQPVQCMVPQTHAETLDWPSPAERRTAVLAERCPDDPDAIPPDLPTVFGERAEHRWVDPTAPPANPASLPQTSLPPGTVLEPLPASPVAEAPDPGGTSTPAAVPSPTSG